MIYVLKCTNTIFIWYITYSVTGTLLVCLVLYEYINDKLLRFWDIYKIAHIWQSALQMIVIIWINNYYNCHLNIH